MRTQQPAAFPRFRRAESNPKIIEFPSVAPAKGADFPRPMGATPPVSLEATARAIAPAPVLLEGDTLEGHLRNAQQLVRFAIALPDTLTPELLRDVARRLELAGQLLTRDVQVLE